MSQLYPNPAYFRHVSAHRHIGTWHERDVHVIVHSSNRRQRVVVVTGSDYTSRDIRQVMTEDYCAGEFWDIVRAALALQGAA